MRAFWRVTPATLVVAATLVSAPCVVAQAGAPDALLPVCPPGKSPLIDTTQVVVVLEAAKSFLDSAYTDAQRHQIRFYADAIARRFVPPATLGDVPALVDLPAYYRDGDDDGSRSLLTGRLIIVVKRDGKVRTIAWEYYPLATILARAIVSAAQAADSAGDFQGIMRPEDKRNDDTLAIEVRSRNEGVPAEFPLMRVRLAGYRGETLARTEKAGHMEYPAAAANRRVGTSGEVRFVVGTNGRAVPGYILVTRAGWRDFVEPMRKTILASTFIPATSGGCQVPALVRQRFRYDASERE
jgi:hypothetical protein